MSANLILAVSVFSLSVLLVGAVCRYAQSYLLDIPNERSAHQLIKPRGGGLGSVLAFFIAILYLFASGQLSDDTLILVSIGLGVAAIGFWDDHMSIAARWRLLAHLVAAILALAYLPPFPLLGSWDWLGLLVSVLFLTWTLNLYNFMDGIDGIAASEVLFVAGSLAWFVGDINLGFASALSCLAFANAGFLVWNWPPAKIFMGDVGSGFMGFMLGIFILLLSHLDLRFAYIGLILFAVFVVDATFTLMRRLLSGQKFYQAHCTHAYQVAARRFGHLWVVLSVWSINLGYLLPLAYISFYLPAYKEVALLMAYLPLGYLVYYFNAGKPLS